MGKDQELLEAARNGNVAVVEKILWQRAKRSGPLASLRRGPGANVQDSSGYSALHHAALNGHKDVVKLLLHHEASTNIVDAKGSSPLHLAAWSGNSEIVRLILNQGPSIPNVNLTTKDNETALHCAAQYGHTEVVEQLLQYRCDSSIRNNRGESALDLAAQYGRLETVELLVRTHPELIESLRSSSASLIFPHTPLHLASRNGHRACVEVLLVAGVYVNTRTSAGTAMHEAALCGKMEVVRTLLDRGVDLTIKDSRDNTVLDLLSQFPAHVTQDITAVIKKHRTSSGIESDADSEHLPPIPVQSSDSLGSPYENVRSGDEFSLEEGSSPTRWQIYHKPRDGDNGVSANSTISLDDALYEESLDEAWKHFQLTDDSDPSSVFDSVFISMSDTLNSINTLTSSDQTPEDKPLNTTLITTPLQATLRASDSTVLPNLCEVLPIPSTLMDTRESCASQDQLSLMLPGKYYGGKESDQLSISSSSSIGGPSSRERRCLPDSSSSGIYLPMTPLSNSQYSLTSSNKISNGVTLSTLQPPKKPPRRNLSVSPIHLQTDMTFSAESHIVRKDYDYLFLAHSGSCKWTEEEQSQEHNKILRRVYHRADQYVDMKLQEQQQKETQEKCVETEFRVDTSITYVLENRPMRITNSDKKLHKHMYGHSKYENCHIDSMLEAENSPKSENVHDPEEIFVSNAFLTLKSSQECLVEEQLNHSRESKIKISEKYLRRMQILLPTSPTHYIQPPTPDHPPPSAIQAEESIHERIRPLSQVYKRRSRDMETETEEELLQFPASDSLNASSGSLSLASIFDKSMSTDNVEEYFGDIPFAGLLKGSVSLERPRTLRRPRKVYSPAIGGNGMGNDVNVTGEQRLDQQDLATASESDNYQLVVGREQSDETRLNLMSPFDEQEEWAKISEIMASFGTGLIRESIFVNELEKEFETRLGLNTDTGSPCALTLVGQWLSKLNLTDYESLFINYGFDDLEFINGVIDMKDLKEMGINSEKECSIIMDAVMLLKNQVEKQPDVIKTQTVDDWLKSIHLDNYTELFRRHLYTDMDRVRRVWEVELAAVLEIQKPAHRKRILTSVKCDHMSNSASHMGNDNGPNLEDLNKDLDALNTNIQQLKEEIREKLPDTEHNINNFILPTSESTAVTTVTGTTVSATSTLKHRKNRPAPQPPQVLSIHNGTLQTSEYLEIRGPSELLFGVPSTLQTQWRHQPKDLVTGCVTYIANYLGSTVVKELRGKESTKKSIQKLKMIYRDPKGTPDITLSISYRGVRFLNTLTNEPICEHEIRNIHCACQDADDLTHFAYITKDHISRTHFCHVFCVLTMDQATEIILTLGQAFEVAYQIAIKDKISSHAIRSQSANQLTNLVSSVSKNFTTTTITDPPLKQLSHNNCHLIESINHNYINSKSKANSKSNIFTTVNISTSNTSSKPPPIQEQQSKHKISSPDKLFCYSNFHSDSISKNFKSNSKPINNNHSIVTKLLGTYDHSHSVNDIKINGNQLNRISTPVDDISIDVKDMKAGSRAPIVLSEEL